MTITYEWVIETLEGPDTSDEVEIVDVDHADTYAEAVDRAKDIPHVRVGLVCDRDDGDRTWAYVTPEGTLPAYMADAYGNLIWPVPTRYALQFGGVRSTTPSRRR
jgi:hypothetical protein